MKRILLAIFMLLASVTGGHESYASGLTQLSEPADADSPKVKSIQFSLDDCMSYAVENSPRIKKQDYVNDSYRQTKNSAVASLFPSISAGVRGDANYGLSVDPLTNTKTNVGNYSNSYYVSAGISIFDGLSSVYALRAANMGVLMGKADLELVKDKVAIETMCAYFDVVYYTQSVIIARERLDASRANYERCIVLEELGLRSYADVLELEAQMASDDYLLTRQQNNLDLAVITLKQAMNYPADRDLPIDTKADIEITAVEFPVQEILDYALDNNPQIASADFALRQTRFGYLAVKGSMYPSIYLSGSWGTSYAHYENQAGLGSFNQQLKDNRGYGFSVSLSIPVFNGLSKRAAAGRHRNSMLIAEQALVETERAVQTEILRNYQEMQGYGKEFIQASKKVDAATQAHCAVERKFEVGQVSTIDLQTSANRLLEAQAERLNARLQYIIRCRLMDYYGGSPLIR